MALHPHTDSAPASSPADTADQRRESVRLPVGRVSTLRGPDDVPRDVQVQDLSQGGFRFTTAEPLAVGTTVRIGLAGGGVSEARIIRVGMGDYACAFVESLTKEQQDAAFTADPIVHARFGSLPAPSTPAPAPVAQRWTVPILAVASVACWATIVAIVSLFR